MPGDGQAQQPEAQRRPVPDVGTENIPSGNRCHPKRPERDPSGRDSRRGCQRVDYFNSGFGRPDEVDDTAGTEPGLLHQVNGALLTATAPLHLRRASERLTASGSSGERGVGLAAKISDVRQVFKHAKEVARIGPAQSDHLPALRVGLSVSVPLLVLLALGRPELSIYAVFGGFTAMYGRNDTYRPRLIHQGRAALLLTSGLAVGVLLSVARAQPWVLVLVESLFAVAGSLVADRMGLRPSGPFYAIFALGACASVPATIPLWLAVSICAASAAFSIVVGVSGWVRNRTWSPPPQAITVDIARSRAMRVHAARYLIAVVIAGTLGVLGGAGHANWTMAAAAVPLAATNTKSRLLRGIHRVIGTLAGILLTAVILLPGFDRTTLTVLLMVLLFPTELFMMRHYGLAMMFFTPAILLMSQLAYPISRHVLVTDRGIETLLGASIGMAVAILVREPETEPRQ